MTTERRTIWLARSPFGSEFPTTSESAVAIYRDRGWTITEFVTCDRTLGVVMEREQVARRSGELEGAASILSYEIETPEQQERLRELLLEHASWLRNSLAPEPPEVEEGDWTPH